MFNPNECESFGSAMLKSRSSDAFTSALKDFIKPINVNIHNCGKVIIRKQTDPAGATQLFDYTKTFNTDPPSSNSFQLADDGVQTYDGVLFGAGSVTEGAVPPTWEFVSLDCSASTGVNVNVSGQTASWTLDDANDVVDCTYTNQQHLGAITIRKQTIKTGNAGLAGAEFSITGPNSYSSTQVSGADGTVCVDHLPWGTYVVTETKAPDGYAIDDPTGNNVEVDNNANCTDNPVGETITFDDTPLTDITATAHSQAPGGTESTVSCVDENGADVGNSPQGPAESPAVAANGLAPGTYTCTIVVDP